MESESGVPGSNPSLRSSFSDLLRSTEEFGGLSKVI